MKIKICGITTLDEIQYINLLKPDYIGFVFTSSKRQVSIEKAKELICNLDKEILVVGVFKDNSINEIENIIKEVKLDVIQLHGSEDEIFIKKLRFIINGAISNNIENNKVVNKGDYISDEDIIEARIEFLDTGYKHLKSKQIEIWKGISIKNKGDIEGRINLNVDNFILDGGNPGSGESFNWNLISGINKKFFLAGGVGLNNIDEIVQNIKPYGIDVSSGVESVDAYGKSKKDICKMKSLIEKVRKII